MRLPHARAACTGPCGCSSCSCSLLSGSSHVSPRLACLCQCQLLCRFRNELRVLSPGSLPRGRSLPFPRLPLPSLAFPCFPLLSLSFPSLPFPSLGLLLDLAREGQLLLHSHPTQEAGLSLEQHMAARCTAGRSWLHGNEREKTQTGSKSKSTPRAERDRAACR